MTFRSSAEMHDYADAITAIVRFRLHADPRTRDLPREELDRRIELAVCQTVLDGMRTSWLEQPIGGHTH